MMSLQDYHQTTGDWRAQIKKNQRKTRFVIMTFIGIYVFVGLIADTFILMSLYPRATIEQCLYALITFQKPPYATLIMGGIAILSLLITYALYDRIMLMGTE